VIPFEQPDGTVRKMLSRAETERVKVHEGEVYESQLVYIWLLQETYSEYAAL
jgi:hypothetical protein